MDEMGFVTNSRHRLDLGGLAHDVYSRDSARSRLFYIGHCHHVAKRFGCGFGRSIRRSGQSDRVWSRGAATFLSRATTWCAIVFMMTSLTLSVKRAPSEGAGINSIIEDTEHPASKPDKAAPPKGIQIPLAPPAQTPAQPAAPPKK